MHGKSRNIVVAASRPAQRGCSEYSAHFDISFLSPATSPLRPPLPPRATCKRMYREVWQSYKSRLARCKFVLTTSHTTVNAWKCPEVSIRAVTPGESTSAPSVIEIRCVYRSRCITKAGAREADQGGERCCCAATCIVRGETAAHKFCASPGQHVESPPCKLRFITEIWLKSNVCIASRALDKHASARRAHAPAVMTYY